MLIAKTLTTVEQRNSKIFAFFKELLVKLTFKKRQIQTDKSLQIIYEYVTICYDMYGRVLKLPQPLRIFSNFFKIGGWLRKSRLQSLRKKY